MRTELRALREALVAMPPAAEPEPATAAKCELLQAEWVVPIGFSGAIGDAERQAIVASLEGKLMGAALAQGIDRVESGWRGQLSLSDAALEFERSEAERLELLAETLERFHELLSGIAALGHPSSGERR